MPVETKTAKKPRPCPPPAPKAPTSLYKAIRERLEAKDRDTLHERTTKAVEGVEAMLFGWSPDLYMGPMATFEHLERIKPTKTAPAPWSLEGLVVDPGPAAVGQWGFFWDGSDSIFGELGEHDGSDIPYRTINGGWYPAFAYIPNFPGAELLKRITGYETAK